MKGIYYKTPINFQSIIQKEDASKTNLEDSIVRELNLILTTALGECKFDLNVGCAIWEMDFDILCTHNVLKTKIHDSIRDAINRNICRLQLESLKVEVYEQSVAAADYAMRTKKKVELQVIGKIKQTNRVFNYSGYFFLGPLSYN